ncbi:MAG: Sec-independent protein translocase subunit TatA/TatB [Candidatus Zixiibacteriota bacterium]
MFGLGPWELLLIFLAILLLFGAKRLPEIAQGMGKGIKEFKRAMKDTTDEIKNSVENSNNDSGKKNDDKK